MKILKIQKIVNKFFNNKVISNTAEIYSFTIDRDYFLDVFETRYEVSIDIGRPIKGLKETLNLFKASSDKEIQSTSIKDTDLDIILYTDTLFKQTYGIVNFLD